MNGIADWSLFKKLTTDWCYVDSFFFWVPPWDSKYPLVVGGLFGIVHTDWAFFRLPFPTMRVLGWILSWLTSNGT